jgi:uroporphyrinogen-III decarboxylase
MRMTSRQRLLTALRGGTPDRVPVAPFELGRVDPDSAVGRELIARTDPFITVGGGGDPFLGRKVPCTTCQDGEYTTTVFHTPAGDLVLRHRRTAVTAATVEFPCQDAADVEKLLSLPYEPPRIDLTAYRAWRERVGEEALVMVGIGNAVCFPATMLAPEQFSLLWADAPEAMARMTGIASQRLNDYVERLCQAGVDAFRIVGGEYVTCQLGPRSFEALIRPFDTTLCQVMRRHGAVVYYHNHGPIMRWLELIAELGVDALDPLEAPPWGDCDLCEAKRRIGDRVCLVGNLDDMEVLEQWEADAVRELGRQRIQEAGTTGFILGGTASGTYTERAARNFMALVDVAEAMSRE